MFTKALVIDIYRSAIQSKTGNEYCKNVLHTVVGPFGARGVSLWRSNEEATLKPAGTAGYNDHSDCNLGVPLWKDVPLCNSVRNNTIIVRPTEESTQAVEEGRADTEELWTINAPVRQHGMVIGGVQIYFDEEPNPELVETGLIEILTVTAECFVAGDKSNHWADDMIRASRDGHMSASMSKELSTRQRMILNHLAQGLTYFQIGQALIISESTAKQEATRIFRKLEVANRFEAVSVGVAKGLISREDAAGQI